MIIILQPAPQPGRFESIEGKALCFMGKSGRAEENGNGKRQGSPRFWTHLVTTVQLLSYGIWRSMQSFW